MAFHAVLAALLWLGAAHAAPQLPTAAVTGGSLPLPDDDGCQRKCGGLDIPYPFGNGPEHCRLPDFLIECRNDDTGVLKPFLGRSIVEVIDISLSSGQVRVLNNISYYCNDTSFDEWSWKLSEAYTYSATANKFTVMGCRTWAYIGYAEDDAVTYRTGCEPTCRSDNLPPQLIRDGSCSGVGCCQTAVPSGLQYYTVSFHPNSSASGSHCSYAVLMDSSNLSFSTNYMTSLDLHDKLVPVVLDWAIGHDDCLVASTKPGYACVSSNSRCINATGGQGGYICTCKEGFQGNPYRPEGCQDINECDDPIKYPCFGKCSNTNGTFTCSCPPGWRGNPSIEKCQKDRFPLGAQLILGIFAGLLVVLIALLATQVVLKERSKRRQRYFEQHGSQMLSRILKREGNITFFERGDIVKATRSFHKANIIGEGADGTVYRGIINIGGSSVPVAVKRCKGIDKGRKEEFIQELIILCRVNHPNIVKLLGCCFHFEAPMLVSEFMQNGTLNNLLHRRPRRRLTLATRLRIAAEVAEALAHLHSPPQMTLHGDVKPENILLGEGWVAKVSDFGCSTIDDNIQVVPKGTLAYLDPEFLLDFQITDKTDVYSLGVVLMELLIRKKPPAKQQKNLRIIFQESMGDGTLIELVDADIIIEEGGMRVIHQVAELASRCTAVPGTKRPAMGQVAEELRRLSNEMPEGYQALQDIEGRRYNCAVTETETMAFTSVGSVAPLSTELAR